MIPKVLRRIACVCGLLGLAVGATPLTAPSAEVARNRPTAEQVVGNGSLMAMLGCAGCAVGAAYLLTSGTGWLIIALNAEGGAAVAASCALTCYNAVS